MDRPELDEAGLFASDSGTLIRVETDPVVGGRYSILELNEGLEIDHFGHYLVVDPPVALCFTLDVPQHFQESPHISISIEESGGGSLLTFSQTGIDPDLTRQLWRNMLDQLLATMA